MDGRRDGQMDRRTDVLSLDMSKIVPKIFKDVPYFKVTF